MRWSVSVSKKLIRTAGRYSILVLRIYLAVAGCGEQQTASQHHHACMRMHHHACSQDANSERTSITSYWNSKRQ